MCNVSKSPLPFIVSYVFGGLKIENNILITCGLLHVYEQTGLTCLAISILAHTSLLISVCAILASTRSPLHLLASCVL